MTIRHLKIFIAVAETGQMSRAATALYLSQPTVSQAIRELEEHYHTLLFERLSKRLYITEDGKQLLSYAREAVRSFDVLEAQMQKASETEHVRIGATVTVGCCLLPSLLEDFSKLRPQVDTYSYIGNTRTIEEKLLHAELDVGIVEGKIKSTDLVSLPLVEDFLVLACSPSHPFAAKTFFRAQELHGMDFVMREEGSGTRALFEEYLAAHRVSVRCRIEAPIPEAIRHAVRYNGCLAAISVRLIEEDIKKGTIHMLRPEGDSWNRTFHLVYHKDKYVSNSVSLLKKLLHQYKKPELFI